LAHQHVAALEVQGFELGGEARALGVLEIVEDLDAVEAVLGDLRFHRSFLSLGDSPQTSLSPAPRSENSRGLKRVKALRWAALGACTAACASTQGALGAMRSKGPRGGLAPRSILLIEGAPDRAGRRIVVFAPGTR